MISTGKNYPDLFNHISAARALQLLREKKAIFTVKIALRSSWLSQ
jgi:hypothetical protein